MATAGHIPLPYVMGYDTRPLLTMPEKSKFLNAAADHNHYLFLEHDAHNQIITVEHTEKGVRLKDVFTCEAIFKRKAKHKKIPFQILKMGFLIELNWMVYSRIIFFAEAASPLIK